MAPLRHVSVFCIPSDWSQVAGWDQKWRGVYPGDSGSSSVQGQAISGDPSRKQWNTYVWGDAVYALRFGLKEDPKQMKAWNSQIDPEGGHIGANCRNV